MWWKREPRDFKAELDAHLELEADDLRSEGLTPEASKVAARRALGNRTSAEERFYESGHCMFGQHLLRDLRFAVRLLLKDATFSTLAILGLALGIGVSTAIFALIMSTMGLADRANLQDSASEYHLKACKQCATEVKDLKQFDARMLAEGQVRWRPRRPARTRFQSLSLQHRRLTTPPGKRHHS
jgi:hypothetical protein